MEIRCIKLKVELEKNTIEHTKSILYDSKNYLENIGLAVRLYLE